NTRPRMRLFCNWITESKIVSVRCSYFLCRTENQMDDRTLLELAAKAAGLPLADWHEGSDQFLILDATADWPRSMFAPLTDDGDVFRLAVKLGINVWQYLKHKEVS